jgi:hypothetical protein
MLVEKYMMSFLKVKNQQHIIKVVKLLGHIIKVVKLLGHIKGVEVF